jgi:hypothetical protein
MNKINEDMATYIEQWPSSGLTKAAYCKEKGITYHRFLYFVKRYEKDSGVTGFTLLEPKVSNESIKFHLPNGCYFSIPENCSVSTLKKLIQLC